MVNLRAYKDKIICVAVSGGVDSACLLHYLVARQKECGYTLCAVNFEHGIRGEESVADSAFVKELCEKWNVLLYTYTADCKALANEQKLSLEEAARNFRRERYFALLEEKKADVIATAHHADDVAETVLFRLCRGSALTGARAIDKENDTFIRPLIAWTKAEIYSYARENGVPYREDSTNFIADVTRNKIRLEILPALEETVGGAKRNLCRFAQIAAEDDEYLFNLAKSLILRENEAQTGDLWDSGYRLKFSQEKPLFRRACLRVLKELGLEKNYTFAHLESVYELQFLQSGTSVVLPQEIVVKKEHDKIAFFRLSNSTKNEKSKAVPFQIGRFNVGRYLVCVSFEPLQEVQNAFKVLKADYDVMRKDGVIRTRETGDTIEKFGGGKRTVKKYLIDKKVPVSKRDDLPMIAKENSSEVYALFGVEIAESVKITEQTKRVCYLAIIEKE